MGSTEALGLVAGALTTLAGLPQLVRAVRTRSSTDLSLTAMVSFALGVALWIVYGLALGAVPVVVWNVVTLLIYLALIGVKVSHRI